jgi:group I intron endonuclease
LLKYGYSKFKLEVLKYCSPAKCLKWEQKFLNFLKPEYNILQIAGSLLGFKHSEKTLNQLRGRKRSLEHKAKISASMFGKNNAKNQPSSLKIEVTDLEKNISTIFNSMGEAARALKIAQAIISTYFRNNQKKPYKGRYVFTKIDS